MLVLGAIRTSVTLSLCGGRMMQNVYGPYQNALAAASATMHRFFVFGDYGVLEGCAPSQLGRMRTALTEQRPPEEVVGK